ncbi:hypothetical protein BCD67_02955 [Oscillatoriales cyanobacterium USR001]|nr:hypothetical protein BCD67_02955 [Oscillatoriales cyanobacterium USR001]
MLFKYIIGYWLLVIGYWLLVIGYWLLVIGYWLTASQLRSLLTANSKIISSLGSFKKGRL